jgi:hypothetical protein
MTVVGSAINSRMILIRRDCATLDRILSRKAPLGAARRHRARVRRPSRPRCCRTAADAARAATNRRSAETGCSGTAGASSGSVRPSVLSASSEPSSISPKPVSVRSEAEHVQVTELKPQKFCIPFGPICQSATSVSPKLAGGFRPQMPHRQLSCAVYYNKGRPSILVATHVGASRDQAVLGVR